MGSSKPTSQTVFVREATGLVREVGAWPSFMATWMLVTGGVPILILTYFSSYPGANFPLVFLIALLPSVALAALYTIFSISMPRSGGDYVFVSRGLHPFLGFVNSFSLASGFIISNGVYAVFLISYISYQFYTQGIVDNNSTLQNIGGALGTPTSLFISAVIFLFVAFVIAIVRPRYAWKFVLWAGIVSIVATIVMFVVLGTINQSTFQRAYDAFIITNNSTLTSSGYSNITTYQQTIATAGFSPPSNVILASLAAFPLAWYSYTWYTLPSVWAGEIKQARRSMPITIIGAVLWIGVYYILFLFLTGNAFGQPFLTSWSSLASATGSLPNTLSVYIPFFTYLVYHSPIISLILFIALWLPNMMATPPLIIASTRYMFSWSFDRLLPDKVASVNERTNTPVIASIIALIASLPGAVLQAFYPTSTPTVIIPIFTFGYILPALTGIVFPYIKKNIYETAFVIRRKVLFLPLVTWLGIVSFVSLIIGTYSLYMGGFASFKLPDYVFYGTAYGLGIIIFVVAYFARRTRGIDLLLAFREIPPE